MVILEQYKEIENSDISKYIFNINQRKDTLLQLFLIIQDYYLNKSDIYDVYSNNIIKMNLFMFYKISKIIQENFNHTYYYLSNEELEKIKLYEKKTNGEPICQDENGKYIYIDEFFKIFNSIS